MDAIPMMFSRQELADLHHCITRQTDHERGLISDVRMGDVVRNTDQIAGLVEVFEAQCARYDALKARLVQVLEAMELEV